MADSSDQKKEVLAGGTAEDQQERGEAVHPDEGGRPPASKGAREPLWKNKVFWGGMGAVAVLTVGLGVGLGVGLNRGAAKDAVVGGGDSGGGGGDDIGPDEDGGGGGDDIGPDEDGGGGGGDTGPAEVQEAGAGDLSKQIFYSSSLEAPIPWTMSSFSQEVLLPYEDCSQLRSDLVQASNQLASKLITYYAQFDDMGWMEEGPMMDTSAPSDSSPESTNGGAQAGRESSYETNVQVVGVDEADFVKSDGETVFAAYGNRITTWDAEAGTVLTETFMPAIPFNESDCHHPPPYEPMPTEATEGVNETEMTNATSDSTGEADEGMTSDMVADESMPSRYWCRPPQARVDNLLLHGNRLVALVSGYKDYYYPYWTLEDEDRPILSDYGSLQARVYDTEAFTQVTAEDGSTRTELKLLGSYDLPGYYQDARSVDENAYIVTMTNIQTYDYFERHLSRWGWQSKYEGMDKTEYEDLAKKTAEEVIPQFVDKLMAEIQDREEGDCSRITRLAMFQTGDVDADDHSWWDRGVFGGLTQVSNFDMAAAVDPESTTGVGGSDVMTSTAFVPNTWGTKLYATRDKLFVAGHGYDEHQELGYVESTFLYGYALPEDGSPPKAESVGKVAGTLLNQFAMDMYEGHLRVATTINERWECLEPEPKEDEGTNETDLERPVYCDHVRVRNTTNLVTVLKVPTAAEDGPVMDAVGQTPNLGKPNERITAVRFVEDLGFIVTFERRDPFIVADFGDPTNPEVLGELDISGFSNYLHPTGDGETIIAVGQETDSEGTPIGLQITLFSFADKSNPVALVRKMVMEGREHSYSEVDWNHHAFRYLPESEVVILPATARNWWTEDDASQGDFDGFFIFDVNKEGIEERFNVNLAGLYDNDMCYDGYLQARSMVFDGFVMLMKNQAVVSYDIDTEDEMWGFTISQGHQCYYW